MRIRHEYYCPLSKPVRLVAIELPQGPKLRHPRESDLQELAELMLDSYRGTIDYDGETIREARSEVRSYLESEESIPLLSCSYVAVLRDQLLSACLMSKWEKRADPLISYVMTRAAFKGKGLASMLLTRALERIRTAGNTGVRGLVTEGNTPSERVLLGLGFKRVT